VRTLHLARGFSLLKALKSDTPSPQSSFCGVLYPAGKKVCHIGEYLHLEYFLITVGVLCFSVVGLGVEEEHHSKIIHCEMYTFIN